jgi:CRISPR-associated endonuclease/helicase Cas3
MMASFVPNKLLAKSANQLSLIQHTRDVVDCAQALFGPQSRWGAAWLRFFKIPAAEHERFLLNLRVACWLHDLGKANVDFQGLVSGRSRTPQSMRHEHLSALWIMTGELREWLEQNPALDVDAICAAVLSHHIKAAERGDGEWGRLGKGGQVVEVFGAHPDVTRILGLVGQAAALAGPPPTLLTTPYSLGDPDWSDVRDAGEDAAQRFFESRDDDRRRMMLALKLGLMAADAAGSGLRREGHPMSAWIGDVIQEALTKEELDELIEQKALAITKIKKVPFEPRAFQTGAGALGDRALLLAGCGTGKTLAAWYWLRGVVARRPGKIGRVLFLYPTRGTATEGFRDYVSWAPPEESALLHGTSEWDLERMMCNPADAARAQGAQLDHDMQRLFALGHWPRRYFSATVDQFLSAMEHHYGAICRLPLLADAAVVIDEVHSFDTHMFADLISFLEHFDVPVLCMTATLPSKRREQLMARGLEVYPRAEHAEQLKDLEQAETAPRYKARLGEVEAARERVCELSSGRVLWVVNTVDECQQEARRLAELLGERAKVHCYHSRFKLEDRGDHHSAVVKAFQPGEAGAGLVIAVTTQVCEMSLDLDADLLVTALAPPSSLVQRMGRANRQGANPALGEVWIFEPAGRLPYKDEELEAARTMLAALHVTSDLPVTLHQRELAEALEAVGLSEPQADGNSRLISAGFYAMPGDFRDSDAFTMPCVLDSEVAAVLARLKARLSIDAYVVPVPRRHAGNGTGGGWPSWLGVADHQQYTREYGFERPRAPEEV